MILILPIILIMLWLESTIISLPLMLIIIMIIHILYKEMWVMGFAFLAGLILDIAAVRPLGSTSIFLVCWLFLIILYERKYEIDSYQFVLAASFIGSLAFLILFNYPNVIIQAIVNSFIALIIFSSFKSVKIKTQNAKLQLKA